MNGVLSPSANKFKLGLIGNPENRRIRDFQAAAEALGYCRPECLAYEELLRDPDALAKFNVDHIRIDSPGENEAVAKRLIALGGGPKDAELEFGEIAFSQEYHRGFCKVLRAIEERGISCLNAPSEIAVMFDKWESHQRWANNGVMRPPCELAPTDFEILWDRVRFERSGRWFLKPLHGSSASGVCALRWTPNGQQMISPLKIRESRGRVALINSLEVCTYTTLEDIRLILRRLLPQGMILEQWIPKLTPPGGAIDLRILVIAGEARHWVVRQSKSPMTNLHLGNQRGDKTALLDLIGIEKLDAAFRMAERAAASFPDSLYAGVDILIDSRHRAVVGEINAFGDLLPGIIDRDESAYAAIAKFSHAPRCLV